jgi:PPM family protein phosphatase
MFEILKKVPVRSTNPGLFECRVDASVASDQGPHRQTNEDCGQVIVSGKGVLVIVADGMGGHKGGEVASAMTVRMVKEGFAASEADPGTALVKAVQEANREIYGVARRHAQLAGMGTTCTAVVVVDGMAYSAHVGDSRAYLVRGEQIYRMTEDHSATMAMVKQGVLTLKEAREHEDRNVILRAVGTHEEVEVETWERPLALHPGDRMLLCSDGLHDVVEDAEMRAIAGANEPAEACARLVKLALDRDCTDNVTVAVLRVSEASEKTGTTT